MDYDEAHLRRDEELKRIEEMDEDEGFIFSDTPGGGLSTTGGQDIKLTTQGESQLVPGAGQQPSKESQVIRPKQKRPE
jgi:hypothetical protein